MTPGIGCRDLRVYAGSRELLHVVELDVPPGSVLAILGRNGAGKSTLLRALGMLGPHRVSGEILLDGRLASRSLLRVSAAAVLQRPILRRGTVAANVASGLRFHGVPRAEVGERSAPWLDGLGIAHLVGRDVRSLSGGEAQRVCIARALAVGPRVLLLDEPFTGLDATTRADLLADLHTALDGRRTATVLVTHDRHEAAALADDVALLVDGRIRQFGPTRQVLDGPRDVDCARLLGFANVIPADMGAMVARPEHTRLDLTGRGATGEGRVVGTLRRIVALGPATRVDVDTAGGSLTCLYAGEPSDGPLPPVGGAVTVVLGQPRPVGIPVARRPRNSVADAIGAP